MGWLARRRARRLAEMRRVMAEAVQEQSVPSMAQAFLEALGKFADMQMNFSKNLADVNIKRSAALIGSRGGRTTQARKKLAKIAGECPWCKGDSSVTALDWHRANHRSSNGNGGQPTDNLSQPERAE